MLRIPGSHNFKCIHGNSDTADWTTGVKIIKRWNGSRPRINPLLCDFHVYQVDRKVQEINFALQQQQQIKDGPCLVNSIDWIEKLLQIAIEDYRKATVNLILAPYLINIQKLSYEQSFVIINDWLSICDSIRRLDSNFNSLVKYALKKANKTGLKPLKLETLKLKNRALHNSVI